MFKEIINYFTKKESFGYCHEMRVDELTHFARSAILSVEDSDNPGLSKFIITKNIKYYMDFDGDLNEYRGVFIDSKNQFKNFDEVQIIQAKLENSNILFFVRKQPEINKLNVMPESVDDLDEIQSMTKRSSKNT
jgi:hypothetical protein